jgi:hypothetical protein
MVSDVRDEVFGGLISPGPLVTALFYDDLVVYLITLAG